MRKSVFLLMSLVLWLLALQATGWCHAVWNIQMTPPSPASLAFNQNVFFTFNYATDQPGGVRIFIRPITNGATTPNYAAHGSPNYPIGNGTGDGYFTIKSGEVVVDQVRFQMYNDDQSLLLLEFFVPVEYIYSEHAIFNIQISHQSPTCLAFNQHVDVKFDYKTNVPGGARIFVRPFSSGSLTPNYAGHGSPNYPAGTGNGDGYITVTSGDVIVDQLRFRMYNDNQSQLLLEFFVPVRFIFAKHAVVITKLTPLAPASLPLNQDVTVEFDYVTDEASGARIFIRPMSGGSLSPNYAASGSPNFPVGRGSGSGNFTITSGEIVVDQLRIRMLNDNQSQELLQFFVPVQYIFSPHVISNIHLMPPAPAYLTNGHHVDVTFNYRTTEATGARIFVRPFTAGGLTPNYAAHGSPNYPAGSGNGDGYFTITSGSRIVDEIRFRMTNDNQSQVLLEFLIPRTYHYGMLVTDVAQKSAGAGLPETFELRQNYPNPFNPSTNIQYQIARPGQVTLKVFNILGEQVRTLVNQDLTAGYYTAVWDGKDQQSFDVASGIYLLRLEAENQVFTRKMTLVR